VVDSSGNLVPDPAPSSRPFHTLPNVVMSPHRGQSSDTKAKDRLADLASMLGELANTGVLPNRYDLDKGY
jgi:phosphoglycerate dehydrogenase-like enzyme